MIEAGQTLLGPGWTAVEHFDDLDDDEYEDEEEVSFPLPGLADEKEYVVLDLGTSMDARTLQTEATYQLVVSVFPSLPSVPQTLMYRASTHPSPFSRSATTSSSAP